MAEVETLGLIAGEGRLPGAFARAAQDRGRRVYAVAFRDLTDPALVRQVDALEWLDLGAMDPLIDLLQAAGVRDVVMVGKVSKAFLFDRRDELRLDARALGMLSQLPDRCDDSILGVIADELAKEGIRLIPQLDLAPDLVLGEGALGRVLPSAVQLADMEFGWSVAKALGAVDVGQTVVVKDRAVLAVEAIDGTDATIRRGGGLGGSGACVVKVAKPYQDPRFDLPAIGPHTLESMSVVGATSLACEAGGTLVVDRARLVEEADARGIAIYGMRARAHPEPGVQGR
jgi:hypothetical protein